MNLSLSKRWYVAAEKNLLFRVESLNRLDGLRPILCLSDHRYFGSPRNEV